MSRNRGSPENIFDKAGWLTVEIERARGELSELRRRVVIGH
jgi:hypothetical protein